MILFVAGLLSLIITASSDAATIESVMLSVITMLIGYHEIWISYKISDLANKFLMIYNREVNAEENGGDKNEQKAE